MQLRRQGLSAYRTRLPEPGTTDRPGPRSYAVGRCRRQGGTINPETRAPLNVAVCGSCSSRDNFNSRFNPDYKRWFQVVASANQSSMIAMMSPPIETAFEPLKPMNDYDTWNIRSDLRREFLTDLASWRPDVLLVDFFADIHFGVVQLPDGCYLTDNRWKTHHTDLYARHRDAGELTHLTHATEPDRYFELWTQAMDRFAEHVKATSPDSRVVVHRGYNAQALLRPGDPRPVSLRRHTKIANLDVPAANAFWARMDDYAISTYGWESVDLRDLEAPSYVDHPWGPFYVHYTPDYYHRFLAELIKLTLPEDLDARTVSTIELVEAAAREPAERKLATVEADAADLRRRLRRSRARVEELESLGLLRGVRFAIGQRLRSRRDSAKRS